MGRFAFVLVAIATTLMSMTNADSISLTLRDVIKAHLKDGPNPSTWNIDVALATMVAAYPDNAANMEDSSLDKLKEIFQFIPDAHPTVINGILNGEGSQDIIRAFLEMTLDDVEHLVTSLQSVEQMRCLTERDVKSCYSNVSDVTTENPDAAAYGECAKDLSPLTSPLIPAVLDLAITIIKNVQKKFKVGLSCNFELGAAKLFIQTLKLGYPNVPFPTWGWKCK